MRIHWLQHVPFEGLGTIAEWAAQNGHSLHVTRFWANEPLPAPDEVEMLIIMGGPMGVYDDDAYPWLIDEKRFISSLIAHGCRVLGICLGAQLLAESLGSSVYANHEKEIGWFPISFSVGSPSPRLMRLPEHMIVFHWHGDTFDIPDGGIHLARSSACANQAFAVDDRIIGLQFHLEMNEAGMAGLIDNCRDDMQLGRWVQSEPELLHNCDEYRRNCRVVLDNILDNLTKQQ